VSGRHEIVVTSGGARAVRDAETGEVMHPVVGPLIEAERLYAGQSRLAERLLAGPVTVFDVGLGAGSNAAAAWRAAQRVHGQGGALTLVSFENDPGALELALSSPADFGLDGELAAAARALLERGCHESPHVRWRLAHGDVLQKLEKAPERADLVFWDPFSPRANPSLWTEAAFAALRARCSDRALVFTYSASTPVRAALFLAGFFAGSGVAVGSKAETTVAAVRRSDLERPLGERFLQRLERSGAALPPGAAARVRAAIAAADRGG
jgi:queuine tRNA-ribosyltransferase